MDRCNGQVNTVIFSYRDKWTSLRLVSVRPDVNTERGKNSNAIILRSFIKTDGKHVNFFSTICIFSSLTYLLLLQLIQAHADGKKIWQFHIIYVQWFESIALEEYSRCSQSLAQMGQKFGGPKMRVFILEQR